MTEDKKNIGETIGNSMVIVGTVFILISLGWCLWEIIPIIIFSNVPIILKFTAVGVALCLSGILILAFSNGTIGIVNK